jgi:hypothetical protein
VDVTGAAEGRMMRLPEAALRETYHRMYRRYRDALEQIFTFYASSSDKRSTKALVSHAIADGMPDKNE